MIRNRIVSFIATFSLAGALGGAVALAVGAQPAEAPGRHGADPGVKVADAEPGAAAPRAEGGAGRE
ncbi:hypothetical protein SRB5_26600 [Streptomyces sp. RB5]|uniref:Uncharacterized protein n=1 Tax=Streptomyces smaragdinus TaxID=2585196 RepID=A0A7K0CGC5_9ACTN|nr:hypothetical protein [Streptomyces smaragdinus]MQY12525.1 hypothetical protein [Streptomyces smaragdinus]